MVVRVMVRGFVKTAPLPEFLRQTLYDYVSGRYVPGAYSTPEELPAACMEGKTFIFPIVIPKLVGRLLYVTAPGLALFMLAITLMRTYETYEFNYVFAMIFLLVIEAVNIVSIFHERSEKNRTRKLTLVVSPGGIATVMHWPGKDLDEARCECIEWKDVMGIKEVVIGMRGENSQKLDITDRWSQHDQILANFNVPESGIRGLRSASWRAVVKSRDGNIMLLFLTFVDLHEFPIPYPTFLLSELIDTYWKFYRAGNK